MGKIYIRYNPKAGSGDGEQRAQAVGAQYFDGKDVSYVDITKEADSKAFYTSLAADDIVVVCGGDGTLNHFINDTYDLDIKNDVYYYAVGSGNDFLRDIEKQKEVPFKVNEYVKNLPAVIVNGKKYHFVNGVGFGIDGYCCEVGDIERAKGKKPNYTSIAISGLLFHYKPTTAKVTVDGEEFVYNKCWIAPTMFGRYYGGGMLPAPEQRRDNEDGKLSFSTMYNAGKIRTLMVFPSIFKGEHVKKKKQVDVRSGHHIKVEFDRPVALQIDGETFLNVSGYEAFSASYERQLEEKAKQAEATV